MSDTYTHESRKSWHRIKGAPTVEDLKLGCMQRIATACESMAKDHDQLVKDRDWYKQRCEESSVRSDRLARSNAALRGVINRMKRVQEGSDG